MTLNRRSLLRGAGIVAAAAARAPLARAQGASLFPFQDDRGEPVHNSRLPVELSVDDLPGVVWVGAKAPTAVLVEFFDYNCPHCRTASKDIGALVRSDPRLRFGLVNNPIFGSGSLLAAKVQQAVLRGYGPDKTFDFHERLLAMRGMAVGQAALRLVGEMRLDAKAVAQAADLPRIGEVLRRQSHLADVLGFNATPSFVIDGIGMLGYPGPKALARAVSETRKCEKLAC